MQVEYLKAPLDRVAALIGKKGQTKKEIEKRCKVKMAIDSESGDIEITAKTDGFGAYKAANIAKAVARGFSPEHALLLLKDDYYFELMELDELIGKSNKAQWQRKARVIGADGRARQEIEEKTGAFLSVYGKTISVIGKLEEVERAKNAIEMLLGGASHETVFDRLRKEVRIHKFEL